VHPTAMPKAPPRTPARPRRPTSRSMASPPPSPAAVVPIPTPSPEPQQLSIPPSNRPVINTPPAKPVPALSARAVQNAPPGTPAPTPQPAAVALSEGRAPAPGVGIFGESREALLNAKDYLKLKALLHATSEVVIVIDVSEEGKAIRVRSIAGIPSALRDDVARRLMNASYIPQVCSGLPCDGQARIVFNVRGKE